MRCAHASLNDDLSCCVNCYPPTSCRGKQTEQEDASIDDGRFAQAFHVLACRVSASGEHVWSLVVENNGQVTERNAHDQFGAGLTICWEFFSVGMWKYGGCYCCWGFCRRNIEGGSGGRAPLRLFFAFADDGRDLAQRICGVTLTLL